MKGIQGILGALTLGVVIILGAFYTSKNLGATENGAVVALAPERTAIETLDTDGDGTEDWQENLEGRIFETIAAPTSTPLSEEDAPYTPPTTLTGKFSEAFLKDYLDGKIEGEDFTDPTEFIDSAVEAIEKNTQSITHSRAELMIIPSSPESIREYGNRLAGMMQTHSIQNENEAVILQKALAANDPKMLADLAQIREVYVKSIADGLRMQVPDEVAVQHANLLNAFELIKTDIEAMQMAFSDPLIALARTKGYPDDSQKLYLAFQGISQVMTQYNITYKQDEPGRFFNYFDI